MTYPEDMTPAEIERTPEGLLEAIVPHLGDFLAFDVEDIETMAADREAATKVALAIVDYFGVTEMDVRLLEKARGRTDEAEAALEKIAAALTQLLAASQEDRV